MWVMLGVGVLFHATIAALMGLNSFFIAFVATYPAVAYLNALVHSFVSLISSTAGRLTRARLALLARQTRRWLRLRSVES